MQREQPGQSDDFPFPTNYIIFLFAWSQTNDQIVQRLCHCLDTVVLLFVILDPRTHLTKPITSNVTLVLFSYNLQEILELSM